MIELYPYQQEGVAWLANQQHGLLADEMGLGKSAQAVRGCDKIRASTILVVCPASLREMWRKEFERFSIIDRDIAVLGIDSTQPLVNHVNIASFDGAAGKFNEELMKLRYDVLIVDEAHFIKSPTALRTRAVYGYRTVKGFAHISHRVWLFTGTPTPNNPAELYPHCRVLFSGGFKDKNGKIFDKAGFVKRFCTTKNNGFGEVITGGKSLEELKKRLAPYILRRKKSDVLRDLPPIRIENLYLTAERDFISHKDGEAIDFMLELCDQIVHAPDNEHRQGIIDAIDEKVARRLRRLLGMAKVKSLVQWVKDQLESGLDKLVIFAYHHDVLEPLRQELSKVTRVAYLDGDTPPAVREREVQKFQGDEECKIFIGQFQAAGVGHTLVAAAQMVFAEYSWVPGENEQAAMRIHRIGQTRDVLVRYAVVPGTLDERIHDVVRRKTVTTNQLFN
jgi:SNF2 family DNA or RNA helicase